MNRAVVTALLLVLAACGTQSPPGGSRGEVPDPVVTGGLALPPEADAVEFGFDLSGWAFEDVTFREHGEGLRSYGVEIAVRDLATHPQQASATVTVTSAAGTSTTIPTRPELACYSAGTISFGAPARAGQAAVRLGAGPFDYVVDLVLDGTPYTGRATWPDDEIEDYAPNVALAWAPPLPTYAGRDATTPMPGR